MLYIHTMKYNLAIKRSNAVICDHIHEPENIKPATKGQIPQDLMHIQVSQSHINNGMVVLRVLGC
jgi:hypothetical protein